MRFIRKYRHYITAVIAIIFISGMFMYFNKINSIRNNNVKAEVFAGNAMGTVIKKTIYTDNQAINASVDKQIDDAIKALENQISIRYAESEVAKCNRNYAANGTYSLSPNIVEYLRQEMQIYEETDGAFSPCIRPLANLWGIEDGYNVVPEKSDVTITMKYINGDNIQVVDEGIIFKENDMAIDFGAVGKGIACDEVAKVLATTQAQGAVVSIGGSILAYGDKGDGQDWHIGIQDPRAAEGEVLGVVDVKPNTIISTSGDYEKYFEVDGRRYHHIFDPRTGYPANNSLVSVSIISDNGFLSDALSTACFVLGLEDGMAYAKEKGVEAIFVTRNKEVYITDGLNKTFRIQADGYTIVK